MKSIARRKSKVSKKAVFLALTSIALFVILGFVYILNLLSYQRAENTDYLFEVSRQAAVSTKKQIQGDLKNLSAIARSSLSDTILSDAVVYDALGEEVKNNDYLLMGVVLKKGTVLGLDSQGKKSFPVNILDENCIESAMDGNNYVSAVKKDNKTGQSYVLYAVPIHNGKKPVAVLVAAQPTSAFFDIVKNAVYKDVGQSCIIANDGNIICGTDELSGINNIFEHTTDGFSAVQYASLNMKNGLEGSVDLNLNGKNVWASYSPVGIGGWYTVSFVPQYSLGGSFSSTLMLIILGVLAIGIVLLVGLLTLTGGYRKNQEKAIRLAYYDPVTGAYNKNKFNVEATERIRNRAGGYVICSFDINNFKAINELFGFVGGDMLLKYVAQCMSKLVEQDEVFARISNDCFYILLKNAPNAEIESRLMGLMNAVSNYAINRGTQYHIVSCCGVYKVRAEDVYDNMNLLCDRASLARAHKKGKHENIVAFFDESLHRDEAKRNEIENDMRRALNNGEFQVYLQPQFDINNEKVAGAEALIRWNHPDKGRMRPDEFIPVFESNGFITEIDEYVLETVCSALDKWRKKGYEIFPISVNQSRLHLYQTDYTARLTSTINRYNVPAAMIELEMTESIAFENQELLKKITSELHKIGFTLSMDDFGSGYSSLNVLKDLPFNVLKLDKGFFEESSDTDRGRNIIKSVIEMAKDLGMKTISEGIEEYRQVEFLKQAGCDMIQGYYYGRPVSLADFERTVFEKNETF